MDNPRTSRRTAVLIAAGVALALASTAQADELWRPGEPGRWVPGTPMTDSQAVTDWSGFYVGGKVGGIWSDIGWTENFGEFDAPGGAKVTPSSFTGGIFGGGNIQMGNWIFSLEAAFQGMSLNQSTSPVVETDTFKTQIDWLIFVEPRIGYTFDRTMVFVKGGWVGGNATLSASGLTTAGTPASFETTEFVDGWTLGGGIEYALWPSVIVGLDYQYIDLKLSTAASCELCLAGIPIGEPALISGGATMSQVMLRASYLFGPED